MGIEIRYEVTGKSPVIDPDIAIHVYPGLAGGVEQRGAAFEIETGFRAHAVFAGFRAAGSGRQWSGLGHLTNGHGIGLVSMRERADLVEWPAGNSSNHRRADCW